METQGTQGLDTKVNHDSDTARDDDAPPLVNELRKAKLNALEH